MPGIKLEQAGLTMEQVERITLDLDLTPGQKIALLTLHISESRSMSELARERVSPGHIRNLAAAGWIRIKATYRETKNKQVRWVMDEIEPLTEKDKTLGLWVAEFKLNKTIDQTIFTASGLEDAYNRWRHAYPKHELEMLEQADRMEVHEFEDLVAGWLTPNGQTSLPMMLPVRGQRKDWEAMQVDQRIIDNSDLLSGKGERQND